MLPTAKPQVLTEPQKASGADVPHAVRASCLSWGGSLDGPVKLVKPGAIITVEPYHSIPAQQRHYHLEVVPSRYSLRDWARQGLMDSPCARRGARTVGPAWRSRLSLVSEDRSQYSVLRDRQGRRSVAVSNLQKFSSGSYRYPIAVQTVLPKPFRDPASLMTCRECRPELYGTTPNRLVSRWERGSGEGGLPPQL